MNALGISVFSAIRDGTRKFLVEHPTHREQSIDNETMLAQRRNQARRVPFFANYPNRPIINPVSKATIRAYAAKKEEAKRANRGRIRQRAAEKAAAKEASCVS